MREEAMLLDRYWLLASSCECICNLLTWSALQR